MAQTSKSFDELAALHLTVELGYYGSGQVICTRCGGRPSTDEVEHPLPDCVAELGARLAALERAHENHDDE